MSGGVDSSVAAYLLKEAGYDVIGVTMKIWENVDQCDLEKEGGCCGLSAVEDARRVAQKLDIPYYVMNFEQPFQQNVIDYFVKEYTLGRTPNPCIACNRYVKWESLLERSMEIGATYIATGHYARIVKLDNGRYTLQKSVTAAKDQTYALYNLTQDQLSRTLMPVGDYTKDQIREIATAIGLNVADKKDSQEICFIPDDDYATFVKDRAQEAIPPGNFVDEKGSVLGRHKGIIHYTIGQRKGLEIACGVPMYVKEIRAAENQVVLAEGDQLFSKSLLANRLNFMAEATVDETKSLQAKIRYSGQGVPVSVELLEEDLMRVTFETPVRAITPGQAVVLYDGDLVYGGGTIISG